MDAGNKDIIDLYNRILSNKRLTISEYLVFVNTIIDAVNPGEKCTHEMLNILFSMGMGSVVITECCKIISKNPKLFNITTYVLDNNGIIIKQWGFNI